MKQPVLVFALFALLLAPALWAQTPAAPPPAKPAAKDPSVIIRDPLDGDPTLETLTKLENEAGGLEKVAKVKKNINDASNFVSGIRLFEALQKLVEAEVLVPDLFMIHNLKGAVFTKMRLFEKARASFERATQLNPSSFHPKFNLAEIDFVEAAGKTRKKDPAAAAQWARAQRGFEELLKGGADDGTRKLVQFKLTICLLQQGKADQASELISTFSYIDDEPIYWMSEAAAAFQKGDKADAQSRITSANNIWANNPQAVSVYLDSFIELGWVESLAL